MKFIIKIGGNYYEKLIYTLLNLFIFISFIGCNTNVNGNSSSNNLIATGNYDKSPVVLSTDYIEIYVEECATIEVDSKYSVTWYIYDNDEDIIEIKYVEENKYNVYGLKEGNAEAHCLSLNGKSGYCFVKVLK